MKYFQTWQDFMRDPVNKALKESKGIHACKQKFIQEQNKMQWYDPMLLEGQQDAGSTNAANATDGGSTQFITGLTNATSTFTWVPGLTSNYTGSNATGAQFDAVTAMSHHALTTGEDYSHGHVSTRKKVLLAIVTGSHMADLGSVSTTGYDVVVTASYDGGVTGGSLNFGVAGAGLIASGTISATLGDTINGKAITTTGSYVNAIDGNDTFFGDEGGQTFYGYEAPYTSLPSKR